MLAGTQKEKYLNIKYKWKKERPLTHTHTHTGELVNRFRIYHLCMRIELENRHFCTNYNQIKKVNFSSQQSTKGFRNRLTNAFRIASTFAIFYSLCTVYFSGSKSYPIYHSWCKIFYEEFHYISIYIILDFLRFYE